MNDPGREQRVRQIDANPQSYEAIASQPFYQKIDRDLIRRAPEVQQVADFATGTGAAIEHLIELGKLKPGALVHGLDIDGGGLALARLKFADFLEESPSGSTVRFVAANAEAVPLPDASQELVTFLNAAHLTNLERSLPEASRVLKRNGILLLNTVYESTKSYYPPGSERHWGVMVVGARRLAKQRGHTEDIPNPLNLLTYSADDYRRAAQNAGFDDIRIEHRTADMDLPAVLGIFGYEGFARGALPGVDIVLAISCLQDSAEQYFERMRPKGLQAVQRTWMYLEARKAG